MSPLQSIAASIASLLLFLASAISPTIQPAQQGQQASQMPLVSPAQSDISRNWAGYNATNGTFTGVSGTWTVPQVSSTGAIGADATWVGVGGVTTNDLIQAGTQATVNRFGQVSYSAFYEGLPDASQPLDISVHQGDSITATLTKGKNNTWNIALKNNTTGEHASLSIPYDSSLSTAEWIEEAPSGLRQTLPLDNFGTVAISNATAIKNGKNVSASQAEATPIAMAGNGNIALAQASILSSDGTSFSVSRTNQDISQQTAPSYSYSISGRIPFIRRRHRVFDE